MVDPFADEIFKFCISQRKDETIETDLLHKDIVCNEISMSNACAAFIVALIGILP
jgi:hypothetical protein